jgi:hypothetical protein
MKELNYYTEDKSIERFKNYFNGREANIIGNSPSLEKYIDKLKASKITNITMNESIKYVNSFFNVVIHPDEDVYDRCYKDLDLNYHFCMLLSSTVANNLVIKKWLDKKRKVYFFNTSVDTSDIKNEVAEYTKYPSLGAGYSVGYSAITVAIYLGFSKINIYGLDFSYVDNKRYAFEKPIKFSEFNRRQFDVVCNNCDEMVITDTVLQKTRDSILYLMSKNLDIEFKVYGRGILFSDNLKNLISIGDLKNA